MVEPLHSPVWRPIAEAPRDGKVIEAFGVHDWAPDVSDPTTGYCRVQWCTPLEGPPRFLPCETHGRGHNGFTPYLFALIPQEPSDYELRREIERTARRPEDRR